MRQSDQTTECAKNVFRMTLRSEPSKTPVVSPALQAVSVTRMSSEHDQAVLNSIFNPYLPLGEGLSVSGLIEENDKNVEEDKSPATLESKRLELEGVRKAEERDLSEAVHLLTQAIEITPSRASPYNNRAQVLRLLNNDSGTYKFVADALADLSKAVSLSGGRGKVATQALCQMGLIHRRSGDESAARSNFKAAADLGSDFAKQQLAQMNPYAAMCNQMLRQMFDKLQAPSELI